MQTRKYPREIDPEQSDDYSSHADNAIQPGPSCPSQVAQNMEIDLMNEPRLTARPRKQRPLIELSQTEGSTASGAQVYDDAPIRTL